ncbi:MAG: NYN domain-containing protein [Calothrix sp. MO_167.B42]|nr:NYN domain-containing protein [Calothrix sp. MO_167.B42]
MDCSRTKYDSALLKKIGSYVCQTIIFIYEQQPDLLLEKYRNIPWHSSRNQSNLTAKLIKVLNTASDWQTLLQQLRRLLKSLLIPTSFESPILVTLLAKINRLNPHKGELNDSKVVNNGSNGESDHSHYVPDTIDDYQSFKSIDYSYSGAESGIAILLLDAENLQLNLETEKFLSQISHSPLQVKIAFANWQSMGKKDIELHQRGYDLIHVPAGKDNADGKMIAFGTSLQEHYPQVKEVFVCSCDRVMTNLCNQLQKNGITVHHVSQKGSNIQVFDPQKDEVQMYTIVPSIEKVLHQVKEIITVESTRNVNQWIKLSRISKLFSKKYFLDINQVVSHHFPGKTAKDIFAETSDLALHHIPEDNETYVTLFQIPHRSKIRVNTQSDLEKILVAIVNTLVTKTTNKYIPIETLSSKFHKQYGQPVSKVMEKLDLNGNFPSFLHSCDSFILQKMGDRWQVSLKSKSKVKASA